MFLVNSEARFPLRLIRWGGHKLVPYHRNQNSCTAFSQALTSNASVFQYRRAFLDYGSDRVGNHAPRLLLWQEDESPSRVRRSIRKPGQNSHTQVVSVRLIMRRVAFQFLEHANHAGCNPSW